VVGLDTFFMGVVGWYYSLLVMEWYIVVFPAKNISKNPKTQYIIKKTQKNMKKLYKKSIPKTNRQFR
jgi:uncharacterized ion transporter superfamily protein YfcC